MSQDTGIAWTDSTWNPVRGCSRVSEGCRNCYAEKVAARFPWGRSLVDERGRWNGRVEVAERALLAPLSWRKPRRIFVNSMSDLFHESLPDEAIDQVFAVMLASHLLTNKAAHTFQILTKRAERMRRYFAADPVSLLTRWAKEGNSLVTLDDEDMLFEEVVYSRCGAKWREDGTAPHGSFVPWSHPENLFPLPNVWLGVSAEDQQRADERIPILLETPAAVRFVSAEPLLGAVDLTSHFGMLMSEEDSEYGPVLSPGLAWVIAGGESGAGARPCDIAWVRSIVGQCKAAGVACFVKQDSGRRSGQQGRIPDDIWIKEYPRG